MKPASPAFPQLTLSSPETTVTPEDQECRCSSLTVKDSYVSVNQQTLNNLPHFTASSSNLYIHGVHFLRQILTLIWIAVVFTSFCIFNRNVYYGMIDCGNKTQTQICKILIHSYLDLNPFPDFVSTHLLKAHSKELSETIFDN